MIEHILRVFYRFHGRSVGDEQGVGRQFADGSVDFFRAGSSLSDGFATVETHASTFGGPGVEAEQIRSRFPHESETILHIES